MISRSVDSFEAGELVDVVLNDGVVKIQGISSRQELSDFARQQGTIRDPPNRNLVPNQNRITPHTDSAHFPQPSHLLLLYCVQPAQVGGDTILADGKKLYERIKAEDPDLLTYLCQPNAAFFGYGDPVSSPAFLEHDGYVDFRYRGEFAVAPRDETRWAKLGELAAEMSTTTKLNAGECLALNNYRWGHGRTSYQGDRQMFRALVGVDNFPGGFKIQASPS